MESTFGPDHDFVRQAKLINSQMTAKLTPGEGYDAAGVAHDNPTVQSSFQAWQAASQGALDPASKGVAQGKLNAYVQSLFSAEHLVGVEPGKEQVLMKSQAEGYASNLNSGQDYQKLYGGLTGDFGELKSPDGTPLAAKAFSEVVGKKGNVPGAVQLAALNPGRLDNWAAASYTSPLKPTDQASKDIQASIGSNSDLSNFWKANASDPRMATQRASWNQGIEQIAAYRIGQYNESAKVAVDAAIQNTIGSHYSVIPTDAGRTVALPKSFAATPADASALQDKANIALTSLQQSGYKIGQSSNSPADDGMRWNAALKNGYWTYDPGSKALIRYQSGPMGDAPFLLK